MNQPAVRRLCLQPGSSWDLKTRMLWEGEGDTEESFPQGVNQGAGAATGDPFRQDRAGRPTGLGQPAGRPALPGRWGSVPGAAKKPALQAGSTDLTPNVA